MEDESISSSRTTTALYYIGNSYYRRHHQPSPPPPPAAVAAPPDNDYSEDADADDSGWTAYFLQPETSDSKLRRRNGAGGFRCGSASCTVNPNKNKDKQAVVVKGMVKKEDEEDEDPLQDTASSPPLVHLPLQEAVWSRGSDRQPVVHKGDGLGRWARPSSDP